jgi:F-type H+-transporting ATPase subunit gamma
MVNWPILSSDGFLLAKKLSRARFLYIIFTSDRGQAGAFNSNIFIRVRNAIAQDRAEGLEPSVIVFGRKGTSHFSRIDDIELVGAYEDVEDSPEANFFAPVLESVIHNYRDGDFSEVDIIYTKFISSLNQQVQQFPLLPVKLVDDQQPESEKSDEKVYEFEPDLETVIKQAIHIYVEAKLMQSRIESAASENAMRMVAMGNANRNAKDLIESLTLELNSLRQAAITQEIAEITSGTEAITA